MWVFWEVGLGFFLGWVPLLLVLFVCFLTGVLGEDNFSVEIGDDCM